jgi:Cu(I)/Ag(I) efflux system membrane fusion protein
VKEEQTMKSDIRWKTLLAGVAAAGVIAGVVGGFFAANLMMGDMSGMHMGKEGVSAPSGREGEKEGMKGMPMREMDMKGAVAVPAVTRQLIGVRSAPAAFADLEQEIRTVGTVDYDERGLTQVNLRVSGWVQEVFVNSVGRPVRKGEPLFTLYSPDLLATQDEYLVALRTRAQLAASPLADAKDGAAALVASARERLHLWDLTDEQIAVLERRGKAEPVLTVYAPSSGIVLKREALPGKYVEPGTTLYEVADLSTVWVHADIYESEIAMVKLNQPATVTIEAYPGDTFRAKVSYIYPSLNAEARTVRVRLELPNPALKLKPGMFGTVTVRTDAVKTLVVPKEAVLDSGLRQLVYLDRGQGIYEPTPVKLGRKSQDRVEVLEGIKEGDRVVTSANFLLDADSKLASAGSMQAMMGQLGMADWQMRGAYEKKMEGMDMGKGGVSAPPGREGAKGDMEGMKGMSSAPAKAVAETRQVGGLSLTLTTVPETPKAGETVLRLKLADQAGKPVTNGQVLFMYTMPMPGMSESKSTAAHVKDGIYEGKALLGMAGNWEVTVHVVTPGGTSLHEKFSVMVTGGGM